MTLNERIEEIRNDATLIPISKADLVEILRTTDDSPKFCAFTSVTKRDDLSKFDKYFIEVNGAKKKNPNAIPNPFYEDGIYNFTKKVNIVTGFDYAKSIEGRMKKEGIEEPEWEGGQSWHVAINKVLSVHKSDDTKFYMRYQYLENSNQEIEYYFKGDPIAYQLFQAFVKKYDTYANQKQQGLTNVLRFQVVSLDNLVSISIDKNKYRIV